MLVIPHLLRRHIKNGHPYKALSDIAPSLNDQKTYKCICEQCDKKFNQNFNLKYHLKNYHTINTTEVVKNKKKIQYVLLTL